MPKSSRKGAKSSYGLVKLWEDGVVLPRLTRSGVTFQLYVQAWRSLLNSPLNSLLTIATIAVSLLLFGGFVLLLENARDLLVSSPETFRMNVYLRDEVYEGERVAFSHEIEKLPGVEVVIYKSKTDALKEFSKVLGEYSNLLDGVEGENPLPASFEVRFKRSEDTEKQMVNFKAAVGERKEVERAQFREGTLSQIVTLMRMLRTGGLFAVLFMFLMTGFIIASTIKLALYSYRDEIQIMRLVGATEWYVKAPFLIEGCLQGILGAFVSMGLVYALYILIRSVVLSSSLLSYLVPNFHFLSVSGVVLVFFTGVVVGVAGSFFAVRRAMPGQE